MKEKLTNLIKSCRFRGFSQLVYSYLYQKTYKSRAKHNGLKLKNLPNTDFKRKWSQLGHIYESVTLQYYANYTNYLEDIVPESIGRTCIEYVLNPLKFRPYYSDKNMFALICGKENVPLTIICRVNGGGLLDGDLKPITASLDEILVSFDRILLKPTIDTKGGNGIMIFTREGKDFKNGDTILTKDFLLNYGSDFTIQKLVRQHDRLAMLNPTSVNTLRIATYRSPIDEKVHVIASIIRIGKSGSFVDNACSGGKYAGVDLETGKVANELRDANGGRYSAQNGIDFSNLDFTVPGWDIIKDKCIEIAGNIVHHRLVAFDMTITNDMQPMLIEYNVNAFSYWLFMYTGQKPLGDFTDEIIEHCKKKLSK